MEAQDNHAVDTGIVIDDFKFPFSLRTAFRRREFKKIGEVSECMDKLIGRPVISICGVVSANNYIEYQELKLVGNFIYIQLRLSKSFVTTFHLEIITSESISLRITASTLYQGDKPRFLGRSLRLPLPTVEGWIVLCIDMNSILAKYCCSSKSQKAPLSMVALKKVQLCSTMAFRDLITSDKELHSDPKLILKELSVKPDMEPIPWLSMLTICEQSLGENSQTRNTPQKLMLQDHASPLFTASPATFFPVPEKNILLPVAEKQASVFHSLQSSGPNLLASPSPPVLIEKSFGSIMKHSPATMTGSSEKVPLSAKPHITTVVSKDLTSQHESKNVKLPVTAVVKYSIPRVHSSDKVMQMERLLGYAGGPTALLMDGELVVTASGHHIVLLDLRRRDASRPAASSQATKGLWRAFQRSDECDGYRQAFLKGHKYAIGVIETTEKETYMVTGETNVVNPMIILWDLSEGKRLASLRPHSTALCSAAFSPSGSMLVTVGLDSHHRIQISLWDVQTMIREKGTIIGYKSALAPAASGSPVSMMCRQISDFDVSRIRFCPWDETTLVSGGRENIRFWRIRKGHLPGRPVLLNEYSRGYSFKDVAFYAHHDSKRGKESGDDRAGKRIGSAEVLKTTGEFVFACCNKGLLLKINFNNEQVLCAYQLHQPTVVICSLCIHSGYAVTGGDDHKLRIWPMDFGDFLLESHHEGPITNIRVSRDGRSQIIGSSTGTLGLLNVSEHRYNTVMRSHVGPIVGIVGRGPYSSEFTTIGADKTIRVWDALSATQIVEFTSERDDPTSGAYHPQQSEHLFACGFESGHVRIFDIDNAVSVCEKKGHSARVTSVLYFSPISGKLFLASAGLDGKVVLYDATNRYDIARSLTISPESVTAISITANRSGTLLAVGLSHLSSIVLFETADYSVVLQLASVASVITTNGIAASPLLQSSNTQGSPGIGFMQTEKRSLFSNTMNSFPSKSEGQDLSIASNNHLMAPLVSMVFISDDIVEQALLVVTDRHMISIPLSVKDAHVSEDIDDREKFRINRLLSPWEKRSVKRFEFGSPTGLCRDESSGLLFVIAKRPELTRSSSSEGSKRLSRTSALQNIENTVISAQDVASGSMSLSVTSPPINSKSSKINTIGDTTDDNGAYHVSNTSNAVVLMDARHKYFERLKLSVSSAASSQLFENPCGPIVGVCPCLSSGKVVFVDNTGTIVIWNVRMDNLEKIKIDSTLDSPPEPDRKINHVEVAAHGRERLFQSPTTDLTYVKEEQLVVNEEWLGSFGARADLVALGVSADSAEKKIAESDALTREFARAVTFDPSQWSSNTKQEASPRPPLLQNRNISDSVGEGKTEYAAMFGWMDADNSPVPDTGAATSASVHVLHTNAHLESKPSSRDSSPDKDSVLTSLKNSSPSNEVQKPVFCSATRSDKPEVSAIDRSSWYVVINDIWLKQTAYQSLVKTDRRHEFNGRVDRHVDLISHSISVKPSLSPRKDAWLLTDNYNVIFRGISVDSKSTLELPADLNGTCFVTAVALSPSGTYSAAVLSKALGTKNIEDADSYVCIWKNFGMKWVFFGYAEVSVQKISSISWDTEDCLISICAVQEALFPSFPRDTHTPAMLVKVSVLCMTSVNTLLRWANKTDAFENSAFANKVLQECFDANSFMLPLHSVQKLLSGIALLPSRRRSDSNSVSTGAVTENRILPILLCTDTNIFCVTTTLNYVRTDAGGRVTESAVLVNLQNTKIVWTNSAALGTNFVMIEAVNVSPSVIVVAVLNSISQVIFSSFLMVDNIPKICLQKDQKNVRTLSCKVPVANVSGSLTCFAVSVDEQQSSDGDTIRLLLLFGATHGAKVYSVSLNYSSTPKKSFAMKIHSKMRLAFTPMFVCFVPNSEDYKYLNMLLMSSDGHVGVMKSAKKLTAGEKKKHVRYVDMQCPPPTLGEEEDAHDRVGITTSLLLLPGARRDDDVVTLLSAHGDFSLITRKSGILLDRPVYMNHDQWLRELLQTSSTGEVFFPEGASAAPSLNDFVGTCICYLDGYDLFITGTECGKICFFDRYSFDCMKIFQFDKSPELSVFERLHKYPASKVDAVSLSVSVSRGSNAIESALLIAVDSNTFVLVVAQRNGSITLLEVMTELSSSAQQSLSLSSRLISSVRRLQGGGGEFLQSKTTSPTFLVQCAGSIQSKSFGLVRSGHFYLYDVCMADGDSILSYRQVLGANLSSMLHQKLDNSDDISSTDEDTSCHSLLNIVGGHVICGEEVALTDTDCDDSNDSDTIVPVVRTFSLHLVASIASSSRDIDTARKKRNEIDDGDSNSISYLITCTLVVPLLRGNVGSDRDALSVRIEQETTINSSLEAVAFSGTTCYVCTAEAIFRLDLADLSALRIESQYDARIKGVASCTTIEAIASEAITGNWKGSKIHAYGFNEMKPIRDGSCGLLVLRASSPALLFYPCTFQ